MIPTPLRWLVPVVALAAWAVGSSTLRAQTPEEAKAWEAQRAQAQAEARIKAERLVKQREARKTDPMAWVRTLDPMAAGGWTFRAVGPDGSWAAFSTEHQMKRSGRQVTVWLRQEYPEAQKSADGDVYWSNVEKMQYDCAKDQVRVLLVIYYTENNLAGAQQTEVTDAKTAAWNPIVPGTQSELISHWACTLART